MKSSSFNIVILGPQGSGKGTQAKILVKKFQMHHLEMGGILRRIASKKTTLAIKVNRIINIDGRLLPSKFVIDILKQELDKLPTSRGVLFDGFPRNLEQARALDKILKLFNKSLTHVFYMPISHQTTIKRLAARRTCKKCGRIFIAGQDMQRNIRQCPVCRGEIYHREDDKPIAIAKRLAIYHKRTLPVVKYYKQRGILITTSGEPSVQKVAKDIISNLV